MSVYDKKLKSLSDDGYIEFGVILLNPEINQRCTLDRYGRVQYWEVDGSGVMVAPQVSKLDGIPQGQTCYWYNGKLIGFTDCDNSTVII